MVFFNFKLFYLFLILKKKLVTIYSSYRWSPLQLHYKFEKRKKKKSWSSSIRGGSCTYSLRVGVNLHLYCSHLIGARLLSLSRSRCKIALLFYSRSDIYGYKVPSKYIEKFFRMLHNNWWFVSFHFALYINDFFDLMSFYFLIKISPHYWRYIHDLWPHQTCLGMMGCQSWHDPIDAQTQDAQKEMKSTFVEIVFSFVFVCCVFVFFNF